MYSSLLFTLKNTVKFLNKKYFYIKILKKNLYMKKFNFFFFKKCSFIFLFKKTNNLKYLIFLKRIFNFLIGFKIFFKMQGKRLKYFLNNFFFFYKLDTSKYTFIKMMKNIFFKKTKKIINFFFFDILNFKLVKNILKKAGSNKYTKKSVFLYLI